MADKKELMILITTDSMGKGDETLGKTLMKSYLYSLTEADVMPKTIAFLNSGVFLTTEGSPVLEHLSKLAADGVEILSCGACLDYYQLNDKLVAGEVTNMYCNVELMHSADSVIVI